MAGDVTYQATFDSLAIIAKLEAPLRGVSNAEIQLLAYLSCLLAVYRGRPAADWGYSFVRSSWGAPYSQSIETSLKDARAGGLALGDDTLRLSSDGRVLFDFLSRRSEHEWRLQFLDAATGSALAIPAGIIREALGEEPGLRLTALHPGARPLLDTGMVAVLHEHFRALSEAIGPDLDNLLIPSVVWLRYLAEVAAKETARSFASTDVANAS